MQGIRDRVAVVGMGLSKFGDNWAAGAEDMIVDAAYEAFADAGIEPKDLQAAWVGTFTSGVGGVSLARPLRLQYIPITRVENACCTGMEAFRNACYAVAAGLYDVVLALGFEKLKDFGTNIMAEPGAHPAFAAGRTSPGEFAFAATRYFHRYGANRETLAKIAVKNHHNGTLSPKAHFQKEITIEQALKAPMVAWPLGIFDCCPRTDGAAAAIITRADLAKNFKQDYVLVKGLGVATGPGTGRIRQDYDFTHFEENVQCAKRAYVEAGITNPFKELSCAQVHDCFTSTELIIYEDLGFCSRGAGKEYVDGGVFTLNGELPVNTDGGLKSFGHPQGASGLRMIYEVYTQLLNRAGPRQVKNPTMGLAHNIGGFPSEGTTASITILGR